VYASDFPYGQQPNSLLISLRTARVAGLDDEQVRAMLFGNAQRIAAGEAPLEPSKPQGSSLLEQPMALARIHQYLSMAMPMLWMRQPDHVGVLGLALNATNESNGHPAEMEQVRELLLAARELWRVLPEADEENEKRRVARATSRLIQLADIVAVTTTE
jgi:hypothetical protein